MSEGQGERLRDLWLPVLVGVSGLLIALLFWGWLVAFRRAQILATARDTAVESREAVAEALRDQFAMLHGLQSLWRTFGLRPLDEWKANVGQRVDRLPGLTSVVWVDIDEPRNRIAVGRERTAAEIELDAAEARLHTGSPHLAGPERDASGAIRYRIFLPLHTPEDHAGVLVARVSAAPFLENVLRARARGYALSVFWGEEEIFSRDTPSSDPQQDWWRVEESVDLPLGAQWRVVHRPTPEFAAMRLTPVPHYLLAAGVLLSIVLALVAYQFRLIVRQSRFLAASNRALEQRGAELEARVAERTAALEDAVVELEAFNYSVSHDLRSPLGAILNFTAILEEDYPDRPLDADGIGMLARIRRSATRATALLEDLLQLSRAGRAGMTFETIDMRTLARETFAQVRAAEGDTDIEIVIAELPEAIGDRTLLGDVFANLLSNAVKYSRGCEKRRITVSGRAQGDELVYEVADNGHGFDMRFIDKLFVLFERLHADEDIDGTGVGLAMVSRIVKRHGGRVWAEGQPGEGARFSFSLPGKELS